MKKKKILIGIIIGLVLSFITISALIGVFMMFFIWGGPPDVTTNIEKYQEKIFADNNVKTGFIVFPEEIAKSAENVDFYYAYQDTWNVPTLEVFLQCSYNEEDYQAEIQRLENTKKRYGSTVRTLQKEEAGRFHYPTYIAIDGYWDSYEYALLSGERQITYVYTACKSSDSLRKIESDFLPSNYDSQMEEFTGAEGYNIYLKSVDTINGEVVGWQEDNTRDEVVDVLQYHPISVGYNRVGVCTRLDEQGTEIIQYCYYTYYDSMQDSITGLPEEIQFPELEGYEYKGIALKKDKKRFQITYYDGEEEKTFEYEIPEV